MKTKHKEVITAKSMKVFNLSQMAWLLLAAWLTYSVVMLWHFKEVTNWNASMCKVAR
jgi:hypothetical protein